MKLMQAEKCFCQKILLYSMLIILLFGFSLPLSAASFSFSLSGMEITTELKSPEELRFKGLVRPSEDVSGGAAALATVFKYYYNDPVSEKHILDIREKLFNIRISKQISLLGLKEIAEEKKYKVYGLQVTMDGLSRLKLPGILLLNYPKHPHFVVFRGIINNKIILADPIMGNLNIEKESFKTMWNNILIAVEGKGRTRKSINLKQFVGVKAPPINNIDYFLDTSLPYSPDINVNEF